MQQKVGKDWTIKCKSYKTTPNADSLCDVSVFFKDAISPVWQSTGITNTEQLSAEVARALQYIGDIAFEALHGKVTSVFNEFNPLPKHFALDIKKSKEQMSSALLLVDVSLVYIGSKKRFPKIVWTCSVSADECTHFAASQALHLVRLHRTGQRIASFAVYCALLVLSYILYSLFIAL